MRGLLRTSRKDPKVFRAPRRSQQKSPSYRRGTRATRDIPDQRDRRTRSTGRIFTKTSAPLRQSWWCFESVQVVLVDASTKPAAEDGPDIEGRDVSHEGTFWRTTARPAVG